MAHRRCSTLQHVSAPCKMWQCVTMGCSALICGLLQVVDCPLGYLLVNETAPGYCLPCERLSEPTLCTHNVSTCACCILVSAFVFVCAFCSRISHTLLLFPKCPHNNSILALCSCYCSFLDVKCTCLDNHTATRKPTCCDKCTATHYNTLQRT